MDRDSFIETITKQFAEELYQAYLSCETDDGSINYPELKKYMNKIGKAAVAQGMFKKEYDELVRSVIPRNVFEQLAREAGYKKAA